jgi:hypothetical protein
MLVATALARQCIGVMGSRARSGCRNPGQDQRENIGEKTEESRNGEVSRAGNTA